MATTQANPETARGTARQHAGIPPDAVARDPITQAHKERLQQFVGELNEAAKNLLARKRRYDQVYALVTYWSNEVSDRSYLKEHATDLWKLFRNTFGFDVDEAPFEIPAENPRKAFYKAFGAILEKATVGQDKTNLFILYYGGHASIEDGWNGTVTWDSDIRGSQRIYWSSFQHLLEEAGCDLLFFFDCCYGGAMLKPTWKFPQRCELFCSSPPKNKTAGDKNHSFTAELKKALEEEYKKHGNCDIITLSSILSDSKRVDTLNTDPYYSMLSKPTQPSIVLHSTAKTSSNNLLTVPRLQEMSDARVLFKVAFLDHEVLPLVKEWEQFLHFRPSNISSIEAYARDELAMHCCFKARSSSAVMSIPLCLWDSLKPHPAVEFITIIRSGDLLGRQHAPQSESSKLASLTSWDPAQTIQVSDGHDRPTARMQHMTDSRFRELSPPSSGPVIARVKHQYSVKVLDSLASGTRFRQDYKVPRSETRNDKSGLFEVTSLGLFAINHTTVHG